MVNREVKRVDAVWISSLMVVAGTLLLRVAGRRSIAQMTFSSVMVMLSLGTIIAAPISRSSPWVTLFIVCAVLATLVVLEWLQMKFNGLEKLLAGKSLVVIQDGAILEDNLRRLRMSTDKLEMRLRQKGIKRLADVKTATIEANGELGYELQREMEPLTVGQFEQVMSSLVPEIANVLKTSGDRPNIFTEIHDSSANAAHPRHLN